MLKDEEQLVVFLELRVEFNDERFASEFFQDLAFTHNCFFLVELQDLRYMQILDGYQSSCLFFPCQIDVTE